MKALEAKRLGYAIKRVNKPAPKPAPKPTPPPEIKVAVNNDGVAEAIKELKVNNQGIVDSLKELAFKLEPQILRDRPSDSTAMIATLKKVIAANKSVPEKRAYTFEIHRDKKGFIKTIDAVPKD
jgi:hypothetical protein